MTKRKSLVTNASWNIFTSLINILILFIITPVITNDLGEFNYGAYVILGTLGGALSFLSFGCGEATLRFVAYYHARNDRNGVNKTFNATLWLYTVMGLSATIILFAIPQSIINLLNLNEIGERGPLLIRFTILLFFTNFISGSLASIPQALQRYDINSFIQLGQNFLRFIFNLGAVFLGFGLYGLILTNLIVGVFYLITLVIIVKKLLPYIKFYSLPTRKDYKEIFSYSIFSFITQIIGMIWQYCDNILLTIFLGPTSVGYFSIPMLIIGKVNAIQSSAFGVLFPKFSAEKEESRIKSLYLKSTQVSLYLSILIFVPLSIMFKDFLSLWINPEFAEKAGLIATILAFSYIVRGAFLPYESLLKGLGLPKYIMLITAASSLIVLVCDATLIPLIGLNGVGFAYILSSTIGIAAIGIIWKKYIKEDNIILFNKIVIPFLVSLISFSILLFAKNSILNYIELNILSFIIIGILVFSANTLTLFGVIRITDTDFIIEFKHNYLRKILDKCHLRKI